MFEGILAAIGLTVLLKYASIFDFIRTPLTKLAFFESLFACSMCLGFWAGIAVASYFHFVVGETYWLMPLIAPAAAWLFDGLVRALHTVEYLVSEPEGEDEGDE